MKSEKQQVYVGVDLPLSVKNFVAQDHQNSVTLKWDKVGETGVNELYVNTANVDYNVYSTKWEEGWFGPQLTYSNETLIGTVRDKDSFTFDFNTEEGDQAYEYWVVVPKNEAGEGENSVTGLVKGAPYQLPLTEGFKDGETHYFWDYDLNAMNFTQSTDNDGQSVALLTDEAGEHYFLSGKLNLNSVDEPVIAFDIKAQGITSIKVMGAIDSPEANRELQSNIAVNEEFTTVIVPLSTLQGGHYAQVSINAEFTNVSEIDLWTGEVVSLGDILVIDNIRFGSKSNITAVRDIKRDATAQSDYFDLNGRKLAGRPLTKGVFVTDGKKVIVK